MFQVSKDFAPPFNLIAPFFIAGVAFYLLSMVALLFYEPSFSYLEMSVAGWVHLFLVGYVMMIIFGAMAQLVPVVLETGHFSVDWYYIIFPILLIGVIGLILGFWFNPILLSFGGALVLVAMVIFATDTFLTIKKSELKSVTVKAVKVSNIFLLIGIIFGFLMALTLSGFMGVDIARILKAHLFAVVGGYVLVSIYGISLVLLPMFGLAHGFKEQAIKLALDVMVVAIGFVVVGALLDIAIFEHIGYVLSFASVGLYFYQIYLIYQTRVRKEFEIWYASMLFGYGSFLVAFILGLLYLLSGLSQLSLLYSAFWFLFVFFLFLINGHLYKIIPFLVWFHRFSELVGKQKVPMLHEMYPKKAAWMQYYFSLIGAVLVGVGLLFASATLMRAGASFLVIGAIFLVSSVKWMLSFRSENG